MSNWSAGSVAEQWKLVAAERNRNLAAATDAMFELARVAPGMRVLELGTGTGDVAIMAAERVGALGSVVATDASAAMVQSAASAAREVGATNVEVHPMDAGAIDEREASFDAVLARMVLMFVGDLTDAMKGVARVLKPGGRLGASTWSALANNPFHAALIDVARAAGPLPDPPPEVATAFRLSDPSALVRAASAAGLRDIEVRVVAGERRVSSIAEELQKQKGSPLSSSLFALLDDTQRARAWDEVERRWRPFEGPNGVAVFPSEMLVLGAAR